jgi:predicted phage terminase large subunit-like protein
VASHLLQQTLAHIGTASSASTTATTPGQYADCSATTATSPSATAEHPNVSPSLSSTFSITLDAIVEITRTGREEVFDVEIERTENFIANGVVSHNTRWASDDLTGRILDWAAKNGTLDEWEVVELPALLPSGASLWPEQWSVEELLGKKNAMDSRYWSAQYMQNPTSEEGALIKREWWRVWPETKPPKVEFIIQSWDTAFTKSETADYSACTTWGIFQYEDPANGIEKHSAIILLDAFKERMEFPELKKTALKHYTEWKPDAFIIEGKAAGLPLIHELRAQAIPVQEFTPSRGNDKTVRVNAVSDLFSSGMVWRPDTRWAKDVAEECAAFPHGDNDDYVDCTTQALLRYRKGGFITLPSDAKDDPQTFKPRNRVHSRYAWS